MIFDHTDLLSADEYNPRHLPRMNFAQVKLNGLRVMVRKFQGFVDIRTREGKTDFWLHLCDVDEIRDKIASLPKDTVLDCELHVPGLPETSIKTLVANRDPRLQLSPFAMPFLHGEDLRGADYRTVTRKLESLDFEIPETKYGVLSDLAISNLLDEARTRKIEGWVLKAGHYHGWWKLKPVKTVDCIVKRVLPGEGKHLGRMGALEVGFADSDWVTRVGTGFTDAVRTEVWERSGEFVGRVAEVEYDSLAANGALKFPRFKRFRDDKEASSCLIKQIQ